MTPSDSKSLDADDGLTKVVHDLENQLETAKNSQRLADEKIRELEQELKNLKNLEEVCHQRIGKFLPLQRNSKWIAAILVQHQIYFLLVSFVGVDP